MKYIFALIGLICLLNCTAQTDSTQVDTNSVLKPGTEAYDLYWASVYLDDAGQQIEKIRLLKLNSELTSYAGAIIQVILANDIRKNPMRYPHPFLTKLAIPVAVAIVLGVNAVKIQKAEYKLGKSLKESAKNLDRLHKKKLKN